MADPSVNIKCVVVGDGAVGKTCLLGQFVDNKFIKEHVPTVFDNSAKLITYKDQIVNMALWDTAGQEDYARLRPLSYPNTDVFMVCFSMVSPTSLQNVIQKWVPELVHYNQQHNLDEASGGAAKLAPIVLVGNKVDLWQDQAYKGEKVDTADIEKLIEDAAGQIIGPAMMCSALTGEGVEPAFMKAISVTMDNSGTGKAEGCCIIL